ncbi:MAG: response regulator [Candidatus Lokiarchaeota archaeon]|nr:response regulator [Candidatus Lokiarchaeota archaeon]
MSQSKGFILIVDDEKDITLLTQRFLELEDYNIVSANNGREALQIIEERYSEILLVLLDIMMPQISGFDVLKKIKANEKYNNILTVLFSVKNFQMDIQKAKELGADGYLPKTISGKILLDYIKKMLESKK